jgi:predicted transcriptional regulator
MTVAIPPELEQALAARAAQLRISPEQLVREALSWYLQPDESLRDELSAWQEVRDEALDVTEDSP